MKESASDRMHCPKCGSFDVRYSYTQSTWDLILDLLFSMDAFRCRACRVRFHKYDPMGPDEEEEEQVVERRRLARQDDLSHS